MFDELKSNLRQSYDEKAGERDGRTIQPWKLEVRAHYLSLLQQEHKHSLLEIGAGTGLDSLYFQEQGLAVSCIDLSLEMVSMCRAKGLDAYEMDFSCLQFAPASFDAVYSLNCLLHLPHAQLPGVLEGLSAVLKPAGLFYLGVYGGYRHEGIWPDDPYEPQRFFAFYSDEELQKQVTRVFDLVSFQTIPFDKAESGLHFQSCILRKRETEDGREG
jgi:SAM-dependent methyltransferase